MDDDNSITFSSLIAGMLLCKRKIGPIEITNTMSRVMCSGIEILDGEDDDLNSLECCVDIIDDCFFCLKKDLDYETMLTEFVCVQEFLMDVAGDKVLSFLSTDPYFKKYYSDYSSRYSSRVNFYKKLRRRRNFYDGM